MTITAEQQSRATVLAVWLRVRMDCLEYLCPQGKSLVTYLTWRRQIT